MTDRLLASCVRRAPKKAFAYGYTGIAVEGRAVKGDPFDARMDFGVLRLRRGDALRTTTAKECLWVLMQGRLGVVAAGKTSTVVPRIAFRREGPSALHAGVGETIEIRAETACELTAVRTSNPRRMGARLYRNDEFETEDRGAGLAQGACRRLVRTIFDYSSRPEANLVVGEVVNFPGRWSTYPPHHHPQPEIYHYRFTLPQGYGHSEIGEKTFTRSATVIRSRFRATLITPKFPRPVTACIISGWSATSRAGPTEGFKFTPAHRWLLDPKNQGWMPRERAARA